MFRLDSKTVLLDINLVKKIINVVCFKKNNKHFFDLLIQKEIRCKSFSFEKKT